MKRRIYRVTWVITYLAILLCAVCSTPQNGLALNDIISQTRDRLYTSIHAGAEDQHFTCRGELICGSWVIPLFYGARDYRPVWYLETGLIPQARSLIRAIQTADLEGLQPRDYHLATLESLLSDVEKNPSSPRPVDPVTLAEFDLLMTDAFLMLASHMLAGRVNPETIDPEWIALDRTEDVLGILLATLRTDEFYKIVTTLRPPHAGYRGLREALPQYREISATGGWSSLPDGPSVQVGDRDQRIIPLRQRLAMSGELDASLDNGNDLFDEQVENAVRLFQERHGLGTDGIVGRLTRTALNVPAQDRLRQIELNMERWRWLPHELGQRYILVNAANFHLQVVEGAKKVHEMRAIVGRSYRRTPVFSAEMTYLEWNPYWNIPPRNAKKDILPKIKLEPDYLFKKKIRVFQSWREGAPEVDPRSIEWSKVDAGNFPYKLRQDPGPSNALGRVKFMFPNRFDVYIHDTPDRKLFLSPSRGFSSGCIRIEKPIELAEYLLREDPEWTHEKIMAVIQSEVRQVVRLKNPIMVHLLYWTAWAGDDGSVHFREDIYKRDPRLDKALKERPRTGPIPVKRLRKE